MDKYRDAWLLPVLVMLAVLLAPALWNGFPLVFPDTGGYLARPFEQTLMMGRSALYGAFLAFGSRLDFWPVVIAQAALVVWMIQLALRAHDFDSRPWRTALIVVPLSALTGLPFYAAQLMPDILAPCAVLALHLLAFRTARLRAWEKAALAIVIAVAIACHMAILALTLGLYLCLLLLRLLPARVQPPRADLVAPAVALMLGIFLAPASNFAVTGRFAFTPGGVNFLFSRLVQDGLVQKYLAAHCPDPSLKLCAYRTEIEDFSADDWLWDEPSPIFKLGGAEAFEPEARRILLGSFRSEPWLNLRLALAAAADQFNDVATGDGLTPWNWHLEWTLERFAPGTLAAYRASRQAHKEFDFSTMNMIHVPVALGAILALPVILIFRRRLRVRTPDATLAAIVLLALIGNAAICGAFSNPHDRYQSRLVWLAPFALTLALLGRSPRFRSPDAS